MGMPPAQKKKAPSKTDSSKTNALPQKSFKPLLSVSKPPKFSLIESPILIASSAKGAKGKGKAAAVEDVVILTDEAEVDANAEVDMLWVDRYNPQVESELAVHKRKVEHVRLWFQEAFDGGPSGKLRKYRRMLVLTGPAGSAKTATVRVLANELGFKILEWSNSMEDGYSEGNYEREGLAQKFGTFFSRAAACTRLLDLTSASSSSQTTTTSSASSSTQRASQQIVLLEDLPNILHQPTQAAFHAALESFVASPENAPLVIIISDASTRAETRDERLQTGGGWASRDTVDIRCVLPPSLLNSSCVTQIAFNPIAPTLMQRALQEILTKYCDTSNIPSRERPTKADVDLIVETSNGDIRSAIMALQFSCHSQTVSTTKSSRTTRSETKHAKKRVFSSRGLFEAVTRREQALHLFHLLGKVLYNKRKGDPPGSSATMKDKANEAQLDARLNDPPSLPSWLSEHNRRPSRLDVDEMYADSPIDTGLLGLYVHQNYTQFCQELEESEKLCDWLSWIDASGGEHWYQSNPHQFHLLTLGTIHSLPSPVPRKNQKMFKPDYFDVLKRTREAEDALSDVWLWFQNGHGEERVRSRYSKMEIALEMGNVLRLKSSTGVGSAERKDIPPPHDAFSALFFYGVDSAAAGARLDEQTDMQNFEEGFNPSDAVDDRRRRPPSLSWQMDVADDAEDDAKEGAYLSSDDIEDF